MRKFKHIYSIILILAVAITISSCDSSSGPEGVDDSEITPKYEVEMKENTRMFEEKDRDVLVDVDSASQVYTFDASKFGNAPKQGEVIVVSGEIMRKVVSVSNQGGNYVVETEDAALTDVIEDGEIAWNLQPEWDQVAGLKVGNKVMDLDGGITNTIEHEINYGGITHKIRIEPRMDNGEIRACNFKFQMTQKQGNDTKIVLTAEGDVKMPNQQTSISIQGGELSKFRANNKGLTADMKLSLAAAGGTSGNHSLKLPEIALKIPIRFIPTPSGPIPIPFPVSIDIGIQFVTQLTIPDAKCSATAETNARINTDTGFEYTGSSVKTSAKLNGEEIGDGKFDPAAPFGIPVNIEFGVAFPRVGLNIAGQELAFVHTGFTTGAKLSWGPVCKSGYVKMVVEGGYSLKVLGQTIAEEKETFVERQEGVNLDGCKD